MVNSKNTVSCVIVGDGMVGKTSLIRRIAGKQFSSEYVATVTEMATGTVSAYGDRYNVNIKEHEDLTSISGAIQSADVIIFSYSAVDRESFNNVKSLWAPEVRKYNKKIPVVLVATQSDNRDDTNADHVSDAEGQNAIKEINADFYNKCSAATNDGIKNVLESVVCSAVRHTKKKNNILKRVFAR